MAMTLLEAFPNASCHDVLILATDIDAEMVDCAASGIFAADAMRSVNPARVSRFFRRVGAGFEGREDMRAILRFAELNLHNPWPFSMRFDVIFCRNVAIYFDSPTRQRLWLRFAAALAPGGSLFIGHSEQVDGPATSYFQIAGTTHYRRNLVPAPDPSF